MSYEELGTANLCFEREGPVAWCTIDRPEARNAFTPAMYYGIKRAVRITNADEDLAALIITGTGDVFAPGGDLGGRTTDREDDVSQVGFDILPFTAIRESRKPVIAAVNGICHAGGLVIAMMADVCVASERATFRVPELLRGIPDATFAAALPVHVGMAVARDLLLTSRAVDAAEARAIGLISRVAPHDDLRKEALRAAREVLTAAPQARAHVKRMMNERYGVIDYQTMFGAIEQSEELREGMTAFMEKRQPSWMPENFPTEEE
ncbi:MAG TPA: enoyl-CoA hydratase/isomerase family protein [Nocardioides sp.]|nr:enoyl-CoA hydratase/isomerase family protein [Nocardioides sp.]